MGRPWARAHRSSRSSPRSLQSSPCTFTEPHSSTDDQIFQRNSVPYVLLPTGWYDAKCSGHGIVSSRRPFSIVDVHHDWWSLARYQRNWRYHIELSAWITLKSGLAPPDSSSDYVPCIIFDPSSWTYVSRNLIIGSNTLEQIYWPAPSPFTIFVHM